jgi:hypothetical protein
MMETTLGRFGHHPDPANDFCVEVEEIQSIAEDRKIGFANPDDASLEGRIFRAMQFNVGGDEIAVKAKALLREIDARVNARPLTGGVTEEMVEAACFAWLRSLFPSRATDDEIRARINDTDREHVRYILEAAVSALAMSNASRGG